jgi:hypothetical protein
VLSFAVAPWLTSVLLAAAQAPAAKIAPGEVRTLREALGAALVATREAGGDPAAPAVVKALAPWTHAATRRTPAALLEVLRAGPLLDKAPAGIVHYECTSAGWPLRYQVEAPKGGAAAPRAVLLDPGHSAPAPDATWDDAGRTRELLGLRAQLADTPFADCLIVRSEILERAAARGPRAMPNEEVVALAFDDLMRDLVTRHAVDLDRVYLLGHGETGTYAWYLVRALPQRWAGLVVLGARAAWAHRAISNALPVPVYAAHLDGDPQQPLAEHLAACTALEDLGGRLRFVEVGAEEPGGVYGKLGSGLAWAWQEGPRTAFPRALDHRFSTMRTPRAYWIRAAELTRQNDGYGRSHPAARVQAVVDGQTVRLTVENATRLTLALAPELLDLAQPVRVEWNGTVVQEGVVAPDVAAALRSALATGDWRGGGLAELTVAAPPPQ